MNKIKLTSLWILVAAFLLCVSMTLQTSAAPGDLDPSFGSGGKVVTSIGNGDEGATAAAIQSDGNIVVVGIATSNSGVRSVVIRYLNDPILEIEGTQRKDV